MSKKFSPSKRYFSEADSMEDFSDEYFLGMSGRTPLPGYNSATDNMEDRSDAIQAGLSGKTGVGPDPADMTYLSKLKRYAAGGSGAAKRLAKQYADKNSLSGLDTAGIANSTAIANNLGLSNISRDLVNAGFTQDEINHIANIYSRDGKVAALDAIATITGNKDLTLANKAKLAGSLGLDAASNVYDTTLAPASGKAWNAMKTVALNPEDTLQAAAGWSAENPWKAAGAAALGLGALGAAGMYVNKLWNEHKWKSEGCEGMSDNAQKAKCKAFVNAGTIRDLKSALNKCTTEECKQTLINQIQSLA